MVWYLPLKLSVTENGLAAESWVCMDSFVLYKPGSVKDGSKDFGLETSVWGLCIHFYSVSHCKEEDPLVDCQFVK